MLRPARWLLPVAVLAALAGAAPARADDGGEMYGKKCLACHGLDGAGDKPMGRKVGAPDLRRSVLTQDEIEAVIAQGRGKMLPYKDRLTAEQIRAIAGYVKGSLVRPAAPP